MLTLWESVDKVNCEGDGSRVSDPQAPLHSPSVARLRSKNKGLTPDWECAMIW